MKTGRISFNPQLWNLTITWTGVESYMKSFFFFCSFIFISWRLITLKYCSVFLPYIDMNQPWIYMCSPSQFPLPPPSPSHPSGSSQCTIQHPSHASNLGWWSASPLIVYLFQCYSLRTSHPRLLPQSPKSVLYIYVSFSVLHIGLSLPSFKIPYICI